jgi:hypothetical protein
MKTELTSTQLDHITEIIFNLPEVELDQAIAALNAQERAELRTESIEMANRLMAIACRAEPSEAEGGTK